MIDDITVGLHLICTLIRPTKKTQKEVLLPFDGTVLHKHVFFVPAPDL